MNIVASNKKVRLVLKKHQLFSLRSAQPRTSIGCTDGVLWITNSNDPRDHILGASQVFSPKRKGKLIIEAMRDASVDIEER
jgi:hypothetical protein